MIALKLQLIRSVPVDRALITITEPRKPRHKSDQKK
jgi:hypothetical protein